MLTLLYKCEEIRQVGQSATSWEPRAVWELTFRPTDGGRFPVKGDITLVTEDDAMAKPFQVGRTYKVMFEPI